jgi:L-fuculose-phosphate aldolase
VSTERGLRLRLATVARRFSAAGLNPGKSGNFSARLHGGMVITPSGARYDTLHPDDLVYVDEQVGFGGGQGKPSTEWRLHRDIYARFPDAGAVVHTHSPFATTLACLGRGIPAFHYEVAFAGGADIRCAPYETFGTQALSDRALEALEGRRACLLANHGAVAWAEDIEAAADLAEKVEALARLYWQALQVAEPVLLPEAEMARVLERFKGYGH